MLRLKRLYTAFVIAALLLFVALYSRGRISYAYINILLVAMAPLGYLYPRVFTYVYVPVSWLIAYPALVFIFRIGPVDALISVMLSNLLISPYFWYKNVVKHERALRFQALNRRDSDRRALSEDHDRAVRFEGGIKAKESEIVNLYEITKKMSEHLKFEDIFRTFSLFLKENFSFNRCDLLIVDHTDDKPHIDRVYSVWQKEPVDNLPPREVKNERLLDLFSLAPKDVWLTRKENALFLKGLGIESDDVETFVAVPLMSERKIVGILTVKNLPKADLERFVILAMQFALEIKKVLLYEMVEKLAITDSLTGLYVRRYFYERINEELQRSKRYKFEFAFIMLDIDNFKKCNDNYGHMVGDVVIKDISRMIKESVREIDVVGRYGGEEFAIALPETQGESARQVAQRLRKKVEDNVFKAYDEKLKLTVSMGIAMYPKDASDISEIIDKADQALYEAKKSGKNVVCEYKR